MAIFSHPHHHWAYVWIPVFGSFVWFGMLLAMIITWAAQGGGRYAWQDSSVPYISDIGASFLQPLFIAGCSVTSASFILSLSIERLLRHHGRLHAHLRKRERAFASLSILGAVVGGAGLILLSIFDDKNHRSAHDAFLLVFIVGVALSAIFTVVEFRWISHNYIYVRQVRIAYVAKGTIAGILIILAIAYAIAFSLQPDAGAVLEWVIAFGYTLYLLTFAYDLRLSKGVHKYELSGREPKAPPPAMSQNHVV
ncbi:Frag1/DRAM/Sfk1 [Vararia minispora EC-137]|uniref:Frag1/DRAM/Sfk1 n=1 Tax=Vararia minispora EC-137 TaxID=1314806 RepID=A0ACB8QHX6_9AGAM|nr:Frag1/DRAM/Sfk1 [Vararia minispora EC-137]